VKTHSAVAKLSSFENFSQLQVSEIVDAALTNSQVSWILGDQDVYEFMTKFAAEYKDKMDEDGYGNLMESLKELAPKEDEDDGLPF
jgi:hypothetical protein